MMAEVDVPDVGLNASIVVDPTLGDENGQITIVECTPEDRESLLEISGTGEPASKRMKLDDDNFLRVSDSASIKQILFNINQAICLRLDAIETKLEMVSSSTKLLEERLDQLCTGGAPGHRPTPGEGGLDGKDTTPTHNSVGNNSGAGTSLLASTPGKEPGTPGLLSHRKHNSGAVVVGLPTTVKQHIKSSGGSVDSKDGDEDDAEERYVVNLAGSNNMASDENVQSLGPNVTLITLNSEEDFPSGTWLGDENNPEMRVRVPISPSDLLHIHSNCRTAEKMALTLLDYLFDRETQAYSNLSGMGKHGKKQLDPLMIYGVRCHLIHHFNVSEQDWHRIKQNINSKCRTAFRRKVRGLPLTVKSFRGKAPPTYVHIPTQGLPGHHRIHDLGDTSDDSMNQGDESELQIQTEVDVSQASLIPATTSEILQSSGGHIQVLHATPEQVAQLQQTHQIQILQGDQIMQFHTGETQDSVHVAVPMSRGDVEAIQIVNSDVEGAETIHLPPGALGHDVTAEMVGHQGLKVEADTGDSDH